MSIKAILISRLFAVVTGLFLTVGGVRGATYYVRAGATGSGTGADWNNAYPTLPATLARGSTYYVATGSYPGYTFGSAESGTTLVTVLKATTADHGTSTGWNDGYGTGTALFTNRMIINRGYFTLDGRTGGGPGSWTNNFGFKIISLTPDPGIYVSGSRKNVTLRHFEVEGNHGDGDGAGGGGPANDALSIETGTDQTTISYAYLHDMGRCLIFAHGNNMTFEYIYGGKFESTSVEHSEIASIWHTLAPDVNNACTNVTFANCVWSYCNGTGGLIMYADGIKIYGNVFYRMPGDVFPNANGGIATWSHENSVFRRARIFNNSFINLGQFAALGVGFGTFTDDVIVQNNIFYNCRVDFTGVTTHDYNQFITTSGATATSEPHGGTGSAANFNDYLALDFTLKANTSPGADVGAPFNLDPRGVPRTTWTRGAYEFGSTAAVAAPRLTMQRIGNQLQFTWPDNGVTYKLCYTSDPRLATAWITLPNLPSLLNGLSTITVPVPNSSQQFYRLVKQ